MIRPAFFFLLSFLLFLSCKTDSQNNTTHSPGINTNILVKRCAAPPRLDGYAYEDCWKTAEWHPIDQLWLGKPYHKDDFSGRYKMMWSNNSIFILAEIRDDKLSDTHPNGLEKYWDDDCLEIFVDADKSGGNHQYNHNAWAYHISLDGKVTDIGTDSLPHYYPEHVFVTRRSYQNIFTWEVELSVYADDYRDFGQNIPVVLKPGQDLGFAIAYCDNDYSEERENFIGSVPIAGKDKNRGWIDASVFGSITLE